MQAGSDAMFLLVLVAHVMLVAVPTQAFCTAATSAGT